MIQSILIKNFQCHKETYLDLSNGFNIINGPTDEGKSAIIRAIRWAAANNPQGFDFKAHLANGDTLVRLTFTDDQWIERVRGDNENYYSCSTHKKLSALRGKVPDEIQKILNLESINIQSQFDGFFLIDDSPPNIGRYLNDLLNISVIDSSIKNINSAHRENRRKYKENNETIQRYQKEVSSLSWIDNLENEILLYEQKKKELEQSTEKKTYLELKKEVVQNINKKIVHNNIVLSVKDLVLKMMDLQNQYDVKKKQKEDLNKYLILIQNLNFSISKFKIKSESLKEKYNNSIDTNCPFCGQLLPNKGILL